jgi:hypothetical protein
VNTFRRASNADSKNSAILFEFSLRNYPVMVVPLRGTERLRGSLSEAAAAIAARRAAWPVRRRRRRGGEGGWQHGP